MLYCEFFEIIIFVIACNCNEIMFKIWFFELGFLVV